MNHLATDKVIVVYGDLCNDFGPEEVLTITGIYGNCYAVSNSKITRWVKKEYVRLLQPSDTRTFKNFTEQVESLRKQHFDFRLLCKNGDSRLAAAYSSLAANSLTTLRVVEYLFEIYKQEYFNIPNNESDLGLNAIKAATAQEYEIHMNLKLH